MTRVGWLIDHVPFPGGAEMTAQEFRDAAPEGVEIVDCPPGEIQYDLDRYVIHNCVSYSSEEIDVLPADKPLLKYWHDVGPHVHPRVKALLAEQARHICCSPIQVEQMGLEKRHPLLIPPAMNLQPFLDAAAQANGDRRGAVSVGSWANPGKAPHKVAEWGQAHEGVDFYGGGVCAPPGSRQVPHEALPLLLANYRTFVFLPTALEPFGRVVAEAWAAGCEIVTNGLVGATFWITKSPGSLDTAAEDFWKAVLA